MLRNEHKRSVLNRISALNKVWVSIPYQAYFMSCNLDHVLYGKLNTTDEEKEEDAYLFAKRYIDDTEGFLKFLSESDFSIVDDYKGSWSFINKQISINFFASLGTLDSQFFSLSLLK